MELLRFENVSLIYNSALGQTEAIKNISFTADEGEFLAIVGPSGCGKTTILSVISGLLRPTAGRVFIGDKEVVRPDGLVGYMLQNDRLFSWRTIEKNVMLGLEIQKKKTPENVSYALSLIEKYGLSEFRRHHPNQLSGGMRQRAALIRTLAFRPKLLLLDEPFSALDFQTRLSVCDDVHKIIKSEKITALLVTHDISEACSIADRIIVLSRRPAEIKSIHTVDIDAESPLKRREDGRFGLWFDRILKEVSA
jgi:NitT/TauT family transport system ATP-binding protein